MNSLLFFIIATLANEEASLTRIVFDVEITQGEKQVAAKLILSQLDENRLSLHCRKNTTGTIFTYWATNLSDTLYLPHDSVAYRGEAGSVFRLFPDGPALDRGAWLELLLARSSRQLGSFLIEIDSEWRVLRSTLDDWQIRWKERSRSEKKRYSSRVLTPTLKNGTDVRPIAEVGRNWQSHQTPE